MKSFVLTITGFLILCFVLFTGSCKKETDCKAVIKCVDSSGVAVSNANVLLYATVKTTSGTPTTYTADVTASGSTDGGGSVAFTFQLPAIFDIKAVASVGTKTVLGTGVIKLEEGKTINKTVTVK